jgi:substrate import-associated zinc metallohydrolase lipoprotein
MKKTSIYLIVLLFSVIFWSCKEDELSSESIFKDPDPAAMTEFDKWLLNNYTYPYNISFKYKMQDIESNKEYELVPAEIDKAIAIAKIIKHLWIEVYDEVAGVDFTRAYIPKVIHLIGSGAYNSNNTVLLGTAEGGIKVTLYRINDLDPVTVTAEELSSNYLRTMFHEFSHILHQNKNYSEEFAQLSNAYYVADDWSESSETLEKAYKLGFISRYARKEPNEDFVEMIAYFVVRGQANWDNILKQAEKTDPNAEGPDGAAIIRQKFAIIQSYLRDSWNIDIYELRSVFEKRATTLHSLNLTTLE